MINAIQIIGTQRSGSNLLRLMLNQMDEVDAPHPPHILQNFFSLLPKYGNLNEETNFQELIQDICKFVELNPVPWKGIELDRELIRSMCIKNSLIDIFQVIYKLKAESSGAKFWCCKSMVNIHYVKYLEESGIKPYYIHLYRDGRDVALSFKKAIVGEKHMYHIAKQWSNEQKLSQQLVDTLGNERAIQISYEQLIHAPVQTVQKICNFLNIPYNSKVLSYYNSEESDITARSGEMWKNVTRPIMTDNFNKFITELSREEIRIFENVARKNLIKLGYQPYLQLNGNNKFFTRKEIAGFHNENVRLKKLAITKAKKEDLLKRAGQKNWIAEIKSKVRFIVQSAFLVNL